ncbi:MAG: purine-nucleoside phosphorylase [Actinobacteria bacterium]|nr:purine-nucleoside phosphorylase [Actinomycetota bacterium]
MERREEAAVERVTSLCVEAGIPRLRAAVVLGSGLGDAVPGLDGAVEIPFSEIPGWPEAGVPGHAGTLLAGAYRGRGVLVQRGRPHYYQGLEMDEVTFPVRVMAGLGVERILLCNAAGALNPAFERGYHMLVRDHINLMGVNPLRGMRDADGNPAFLDVSSLYDAEAGDHLMARAPSAAWPLAEGVLVAVSGPSYETGAELRFLRLIGGDAVSMSLVPEALVARFLGMSVTGVSVITNAWDLRRPHPMTHEDVLRTAEEAVPVLRDIIAAWLDLQGQPFS